MTIYVLHGKYAVWFYDSHVYWEINKMMTPGWSVHFYVHSALTGCELRSFSNSQVWRQEQEANNVKHGLKAVLRGGFST